MVRGEHEGWDEDGVSDADGNGFDGKGDCE